MITAKKIANLALIALFVVMVIVLLWKWRTRVMSQTPDDEKLVAKINEYAIYMSDFENAIKPPLSNEDIAQNPEQIKEKILNDLLLNKVLVQAAQAQGFDKQKIFMKTIERYWEQTLLKLLLSQKSEELRKSIHITDAQIKERYNRSKHRYFSEIIYLKNAEAASQLSQAGEKFDQIKNSIASQIIKSDPAQWMHIGDFPAIIEDALTSLPPGQISGPLKQSNQWAVVRLLKIEDLEIEPFEKAAPAIKEDLLQRATEESLSRWIELIRKDAKVTINRDILDQIDLREIYGTHEKRGSDEN